MRRPHLSVVVASTGPRGLLDACLDSLRDQCARCGSELIIACRHVPADHVSRAATGLRFVAAAADASEPAVRAAGLAAGEGEWVVLTEDHCVADPAWLERLSDAIMRTASDAKPVHVVGGSVAVSRSGGLLGRAAFVAEYGIYGGRATSRRAPPIAAANVAYHRSVLPDVIGRFAAGEGESEVHNTLHVTGRRLTVAGDAIVRPTMASTFGHSLRDRFEHGRDFAMVRKASRRRRLCVALGAPLLPFLLTLRSYRALAVGDRARCALALPLTLLLLAGWTAGEVTGYVARFWKGS